MANFILKQNVKADSLFVETDFKFSTPDSNTLIVDATNAKLSSLDNFTFMSKIYEWLTLRVKIDWYTKGMNVHKFILLDPLKKMSIVKKDEGAKIIVSESRITIKELEE